MFRNLCGDTSLKGVTLVTNMWGEISQQDGEEREQQLTNKYFKPALDKGATLARHLNTPESAHEIIRGIMEKRREEPLQIQRELVDEKKNILETAAGEVLNTELNDEIRRHQTEMAVMKEEMEKALKEKDEETREDLEEEMKKLQNHINKTRTDLDTMTSRYEEEKTRVDDEIRRVQEKKDKRRRKRQRIWKTAGAAAAVLGTVLLL